MIALISYDQVQYTGANKWSFLYWTGLGAYVVEGDQTDFVTALETAVFDRCHPALRPNALRESWRWGCAAVPPLARATAHTRHPHPAPPTAAAW